VAISRALGRYTLLQIPGLFVIGVSLVLLVRWTSLSEPLAWGLFGLWVLKDVAFYPILRIGYETHAGSGGVDGMLGATGVTQEALAPGAPVTVLVGPERWTARLAAGADPLPAGARVRVVAVRNLTLLVEAAEPSVRS